MSLGWRKFLQLNVLGGGEETPGEVVDLKLSTDPFEIDSDFAADRASDQSLLSRAACIESKVYAWVLQPWLSLVAIFEQKRYGRLLQISTENSAGGSSGCDKATAIFRKPKPSRALNFILIQKGTGAMKGLVRGPQIDDPDVDRTVFG